LAAVRVLGPTSPPIVLFRPSFVHFESSDIYGAGPFISSPHSITLVIVFSSSLSLATMEEARIADAPGVTFFTIYIHDFLYEYSSHSP
jgi:hypothetical protein